MMKNPVNPNTAKPATPRPITVPPPKETFNAWGNEVRAAWVVRTFVLVAIFIPMFPANAEKIAPKMNATIINKCVFTPGIKVIPASTTLDNITNTASKRYSAFKNASAPS